MLHSLENSWKIAIRFLLEKSGLFYYAENASLAMARKQKALWVLSSPPLSAGQGVPRALGRAAQTLWAQPLPATQNTGPGSERGRSCGTKVHGTTRCQQSQDKSWFGEAKSSSVPLVPTGCNSRDRLHVRGCQGLNASERSKVPPIWYSQLIKYRNFQLLHYFSEHNGGLPVSI